MDLPEKTLQIGHLEEPPLVFAYDQRTAHPKDGLFLYGPHGKGTKTKEVRVGVIGTTRGIGFFRGWAKKIMRPVPVPPPGKGEKADRLHLANFPGLEPAFGISFNPDECVELTLDARDIEQATAIINHHEAVAATVKLYAERAKRHRKNDERDVDVWALIIPEIIYDRCRPGSKRTGVPMVPGEFLRRQKKRSDLPLLQTLLSEAGEDIFDDTPDFHRLAKAAFLTMTPTQLLRETTLAPEAFINKHGYPIRRTQDPATIAWNLSTGLYYKTQPRPPWKLAEVRPRVCYVGLVYKNLPNDPNDHACCAAQMFLNEGDGVVFRGANGPWKTADHEYHLGADAARKLLARVLETYADNHSGPPKEVFIHGQTYFNDVEWRAFEAAVPAGTNLVGVRIRQTKGETKLFRNGDYPVLRGTAMLLDERNAYLWTTGYVPQLDTYIGPETPNPLFITVLRSKGPMPNIKSVLTDIMGLTKINYNSANFNDGLPVTVRFAQMVGDVLTMGAAKDSERAPFKFYI
jgi:hypothetical protein